MDVLVVDDEAIARDLISHALGKAGYRVTTATNGEEALDVLSHDHIQLVISDWEMPRMNGIELCKAIRAGSYRGYIHFIMLTNHSRPQDTIEGLRAGADDYVLKPFNPAELIMRVNAGRRIISLETRDLAIFAMAKLAESRDPETGAHLERVRSFCRILAEHLHTLPKFHESVDSEFVRLIYQTSPLHDIGKVAIPDRVLLKPDRLTHDEFEIMKTHAVHGAETLQAALEEYPHARFLQFAHDIALTHHERYDGSGYPRGLSGESIPLCGRIVALADVYDALTSARVYKPAFGHDVARSTIVNERGKHFDPDIVDAFLDRQDAFVEVSEHYRENGRSRPTRRVVPNIVEPALAGELTMAEASASADR